MPENGRGGLNQFFHLFLDFQISIKTKQCESFCIPDFYFNPFSSVFGQKYPLRDLPWPQFLTSAKKQREASGLTFHAKVTPLSKDATTTIGLDSTGQTTTRSPPKPRSQANGRNRARGSFGKEKGEGYASPAIKDNC